MEWTFSVVLVFGIGTFWAWVWTKIALHLQWQSDGAALLMAILVIASTFLSLCIIALPINYIIARNVKQ